jgi:hypothetical protein
MKRLLKLVVVLVMIGGWPLALAAIHVVRTPGQLPAIGSMLPEWGTVHVFTKQRLGFRQTFADTRTWTIDDVLAKPTLTSRMVELGMTSELAPAGTPDQIAAALRGDVKPTPAVDPFKAAKPMELTHPVLVPTTQPDQRSKGIFDFN